MVFLQAVTDKVVGGDYYTLSIRRRYDTDTPLYLDRSDAAHVCGRVRVLYSLDSFDRKPRPHRRPQASSLAGPC